MRKLICLALLAAVVASAEISITQPGGGGGGGGSDMVAQAAAAAAQATGNAANTTGATHTLQIAGLNGRTNVWNKAVTNATVNGLQITNDAAVSVTLQSVLNQGRTGSNAAFLGSVEASAFVDTKGRTKAGIAADGRVPYVGGRTWTGVSAITGSQWSAVCWSPELRLFAAISFSGVSLDRRIMTSLDGATWTARTQPDDDQVWDVCWSPELRLFAAVSSYGIFTSSDGTTWRFTVTAPYYGGYGICWSPDRRLFVALSNGNGTSNMISTSSNGTTWTPRAISSTTHGLAGVCWAPELGLFVAVASSGTGNRVWTSPDGITWTPRTTPADNSWQRVCWSPELRLLVAVSTDGLERVMTSRDGVTWTLGTFGNPEALWNVCWASELRMFAASGGGGNLYTSPDGVAWTQRAVSGNQWRGLCWSPELRRFVTVGSLIADPTQAYFSDAEDRAAVSGVVSSNGVSLQLDNMTLGYSNSMLYFSVPSACTGFVFRVGGSNVLMKQNGTLTYVP